MARCMDEPTRNFRTGNSPGGGGLKTSGGSRSAKGARATAILMSVLRTAQQQSQPLLETIKTLLMASWAGKNPGLLTDILANPS